jgi:hypothetical protein
MKFSNYFVETRRRPDRSGIEMDWIERTYLFPQKEVVQYDGRIRRWRYFDEIGKYLRVIVLEDGITIHNAFFDRSFK